MSFHGLSFFELFMIISRVRKILMDKILKTTVHDNSESANLLQKVLRNRQHIIVFQQIIFEKLFFKNARAR